MLEVLKSITVVKFFLFFIGLEKTRLWPLVTLYDIFQLFTNIHVQEVLYKK